MRTIVSVLILFLTFFNVNAQKKEFKKAKDDFQEIGILAVSVDVPLEIYANPKDKQYLEKIVCTPFNDSHRKFEMNKSLKPFLIYTSYGWDKNSQFGYYYSQLKFRVIKSTDKYFEVLVNDETKEIGYIKKEGRKVVDFVDVQNETWYQGKKETNYFIFTTWSDFLKNVYLIQAENNSIYDKVNGNIIDKSKRNVFKVIDLQGDWIKVIPPPNHNTEEKSGWIKWRENGNLTIRVIEFRIE